MEQLNYRCGWCGQYTDSTGLPIGIPDDNHINLKEELTHGECCIYNEIHTLKQREDEEYYNRMNEAYLNGEL